MPEQPQGQRRRSSSSNGRRAGPYAAARPAARGPWLRAMARRGPGLVDEDQPARGIEIRGCASNQARPLGQECPGDPARWRGRSFFFTRSARGAGRSGGPCRCPPGVPPRSASRRWTSHQRDVPRRSSQRSRNETPHGPRSGASAGPPRPLRLRRRRSRFSRISPSPADRRRRRHAKPRRRLPTASSHPARSPPRHHPARAGPIDSPRPMHARPPFPARILNHVATEFGKSPLPIPVGRKPGSSRRCRARQFSMRSASACTPRGRPRFRRRGPSSTQRSASAAGPSGPPGGRWRRSQASARAEKAPPWPCAAACIRQSAPPSRDVRRRRPAPSRERPPRPRANCAARAFAPPFGARPGGRRPPPPGHASESGPHRGLRGQGPPHSVMAPTWGPASARPFLAGHDPARPGRSAPFPPPVPPSPEISRGGPPLPIARHGASGHSAPPPPPGPGIPAPGVGGFPGRTPSPVR